MGWPQRGRRVRPGVGVWCRCGGQGPSSRVGERLRYAPRRNTIRATPASTTASAPAATRTRTGAKRFSPDGSEFEGAREEAVVTASTAGRDVAALGEGLCVVVLGDGATVLGDGWGVCGPIAGSAPVRTPGPSASLGSTMIQPGASSTPSVKVAPSGCFRPLLSSMSSRNRLPLPRVRRAMPYRYSRWPLTGGATT